MTDRTDILLNEDNDLVIAGGDLAVGLSDEQHIQHILQAAPGHYKQWPLLGANAVAFVGGRSDELKREARLQLLSDGYQVKRLAMNNNELTVEI